MDELLDRYCRVRLINKTNHWRILWNSKVLEKCNTEKKDYTVFLDYFLSFDGKFPFTYELLNVVLGKFIHRYCYRTNNLFNSQRYKIVNKMY